MSERLKSKPVVKHGKPRAFFDVFPRRGEGYTTTHYCPGCGHGTASKLIGEVIDELGIQDRTIFCSPVGCAVFAYYYFDCGNIQCAHGRSPSVATGLRRVLKDAIIILYQGDGDLAGIGLNAILHAANRGENVTVFFINNAVYGMTGGQMAPTTLIGQKTVTSPNGRTVANEGYPMLMAELIDSLTAPVFVERVSLGSAARIVKARKAFRKAMENQVQKKGFSFVEVLSPCPVNWKLSPVEAKKWLIEHMEPVFPVKNFRDRDVKPEALPEPVVSDLVELLQMGEEKMVLPNPQRNTLPEQKVMIAGFGGQGVMSAGVVLAKAAISEGMQATWLPSYGPEVRGGTAHANVIVSGGAIGSPLVAHPNVLLAMNEPSLDFFEKRVSKNGLVLINSSVIERKTNRSDVRAIYVPASEIAADVRLPLAVTIIMLAVYASLSGVVRLETIEQIIAAAAPGPVAEANKKGIRAAYEFVRKHQHS